MPQHQQVDPKDLGISPDDEAIQESLKQVPRSNPPEPDSDGGDGDDERDDDQE